MPDGLLRTLVALFADLRLALEAGFRSLRQRPEDVAILSSILLCIVVSCGKMRKKGANSPNGRNEWHRFIDVCCLRNKSNARSRLR